MPEYLVNLSPSPDMGVEMPPARIVVDVSLDGSARKLIDVRSALLVENRLLQPVELKLENTALKIGDVKEMALSPGEVRPVPLAYVWSRIFAKPSTGSVGQWRYCDAPVNWYHIMRQTDNTLDVHSSAHAWNQNAERYKFAVAVRRRNFPLEVSGAGGSGGGLDGQGARIAPSPSSWIQPAHLITFLPPIVVVNLLPCHLKYRLKGAGAAPDTEVAPGKESCLAVDISEQLTLTLSLDQFPVTADVVLPAGSSNFEARVRVADGNDRPLYLQVAVTPRFGGALRVTVYAPIWVVNKTGLPLVFRHGCQMAIARFKSNDSMEDSIHKLLCVVGIMVARWL